MRILVTGGAGFIGSALIRHLLASGAEKVINVDKLTYASNLDSLTSVSGLSSYAFEQLDIADAPELNRVFSEYKPDAVVHLAAESHVDRSIDGPADFMQTNIMGTYTLLEAALGYWQNLVGTQKDLFRFHHVSTDEVYGDLGEDRSRAGEDAAYRPGSPYSASKAASDHLVRAWHRTYGLPILITNCSNNYGPHQFPEKLIPLMILNALEGRPLPVYGDGQHIRDWLYVEDHVQALYLVLRRGQVGETYNIGGGCEKRNIEVVQTICDILEEIAPDKPTGVSSYERLIRFVQDRPGHDRRYAIDYRKLQDELGWSPLESLESGLHKTIRWYLENQIWCTRVLSGAYRRERLGLQRVVAQ